MDSSAPIPWHVLHREDRAFEITLPGEGASSHIVYSVPHSGRYYPDSFIAQARQKGTALRVSEDAFVDDVVGLTPSLGVYGIACRYARAFCDVNRNPLELDARLIRGELPKSALSLSARVRAGFGVVARCLSANQDIYRQPLDITEVNRRIDLIHRPYHEHLSDLLEAARQSQKKSAILIDWHSMPSAALSTVSGSVGKADIVLGNLHGESCSELLLDKVRKALTSAGLRVALNKPFAGGYIVEHYGRPHAGYEALQIEINRAIYMNEATLEPNSGISRLKDVFTNLTHQLIEG